eukprot:9816061-Prorocentrum_lima.AAC.1
MQSRRPRQDPNRQTPELTPAVVRRWRRLVWCRAVPQAARLYGFPCPAKSFLQVSIPTRRLRAL